MTTTFLFGYAGARRSLAEMEKTHAWGRVHPEMRRRVIALMAACPHDLGFGNGWRSSERQRENWLRNPKVYARPGNSYHESTAPADNGLEFYALAVDLLNYQPAIGWANANAARFGLMHFKDVNNEPWHFQPVEIPTARRDYKPDFHRLRRFTLPGDKPPPPAPPPIPQEDDMKALVSREVDGDGTIWFTVDTLTRHGARNPEHLERLIAAGAIDARTMQPLTRRGIAESWKQISELPTSALDNLMGKAL